LRIIKDGPVSAFFLTTVRWRNVVELERVFNFFHHGLAGFDVDADVVNGQQDQVPAGGG
jgi:hypothetical protein